MRTYYERRAPVYDNWWHGTGQYADRERPGWQERELDDGSRHRIYKRWFTAEALQAELGGGSMLFAGDWFVAVRRG